MVFFSSCNSVKFHSELLNYIDIPVLEIHGKQKQQKRTSTFFEFCPADKGILLCTDVAARGLDIPAVDWIIQVCAGADPQFILFPDTVCIFFLSCHYAMDHPGVWASKRFPPLKPPEWLADAACSELEIKCLITCFFCFRSTTPQMTPASTSTAWAAQQGVGCS